MRKPEPETSSRVIVYAALASALITLLFFYRAFSTGFLYDDWIFLSRADTTPPAQWFDLTQTTYRPFLHVLFFVNLRLFGLDPLPAHVFHVALHIANIVLLFLLTRRITRSDAAAWLALLFYSAHTIHIAGLYWLSASANTVMTFFLLVSFHLYVADKIKRLPLICITFILALMSREQVVCFPLLLLIYDALISRNLMRRKWEPGIYLLIAITFFTLKMQSLGDKVGNYQVMLWGEHVFQNVARYVYWPLEFLFYPLIVLLTSSADTSETARSMLRSKPMFAAVAFVCAIALFVFIRFYRSLDGLQRRWLIFIPAWFAVGISPVLFISGNRVQYYLDISIIGACIGVSALLISLKQSGRIPARLPAAIAGVYLVLSFVAVNGISQNNMQIRNTRIISRTAALLKGLPQARNVVLVDFPDGKQWMFYRGTALEFLLGWKDAKVWNWEDVTQGSGGFFVENYEIWPGSPSGGRLRLDPANTLFLRYHNGNVTDVTADVLAGNYPKP